MPIIVIPILILGDIIAILRHGRLTLRKIHSQDIALSLFRVHPLIGGVVLRKAG
jgi:hypothetical protein